MKQHRLYLLILFSTIIGFVLFEIYKPKPTDWTPTFSNKDKIPYGCELLYKVLPDVFPNQKITDEKVPFFSKKKNVKLPAKSNYLYVYKYFRADSLSLVKLDILSENWLSASRLRFAALSSSLGDIFKLDAPNCFWSSKLYTLMGIKFLALCMAHFPMYAKQ